MKRGIPRPGGIPRPQAAGTRLPQLQQPAAVTRTPVVVARAPVVVARAPAVQVPRRGLAPPKTAPKVRPTPVIAVAPKSTSRILARGPAPQVLSKPTPVLKKLPAPRQSLLPSRPTRQSFGLSRRAAPKVAAVAQPVITIPASPVMAPVVTMPASPIMAAVSMSPVRVGNNIVMVPDEVVQSTPQRSPVRVVATPLSPRTPPSVAFAYSPCSPLDSTVAPDEFSMLSPPSPVGRLEYSSYSPVSANMPLVLAPDPAYSPVQSLFTYGYGDVSPLASEIMPEEFFMLPLELYDEPSTAVLNESVLLQSPSNGQPVVLDVAVTPQPIVTTTSGDHIVCDISMNLRDPMSSPVGSTQGFRRGRARESVIRGGLYNNSLLGLEETIAWDPEVLVNEYNNRIGLTSIYQDGGADLMAFSPTDLIDFGSPNYETDLMSFW